MIRLKGAQKIALILIAHTARLCQCCEMPIIQSFYLSRRTILAFVLMGTMWSSLAVTTPDIKSQLRASDGAFGVAYMLGNLGAFAAAWAAPRLDLRLGRWTMGLSGLAMTLGLLVMGASGNLAVFVVGMGIAALASGVCDIVMNARVADIEAAHDRPVMAINHAAFSFAYAGTAILAGHLRASGATPLFIAALVVGLALAMVLAMRIAPPAAAPSTASKPKPIRTARVVVWMIGGLLLLSFVVEHTVETWSALHLERTLHGTATQGAMGPAIIGVTMGIGRLIGHGVMTRLPLTTVLAVAIAVASTGLVIIGTAPSLAVAYGGLVILGLGASLIYPIAMSLIGQIVAPERRVAAIGVASVIGYSAFLIGPSLVGLSAQAFGLRIAFVLVGGILAAVGFGILPFISRARRQI